MAATIFQSQFTAQQVETALALALTAVQRVNGVAPGGEGGVWVEGPGVDQESLLALAAQVQALSARVAALEGGNGSV